MSLLSTMVHDYNPRIQEVKRGESTSANSKFETLSQIKSLHFELFQTVKTARNIRNLDISLPPPPLFLQRLEHKSVIMGESNRKR